MKKGLKVFLIVVGVISILGFGGCAVSVMLLGSAVNEVDKEMSKQEVITLDEFNKIEKGMTIEEVQKVVGDKGEPASESESGGYKVEIHDFVNANGTNANVTFENGKMTGKAQFGLE